MIPKIKDGEYVINLEKYESIGTHWIALYVNGNKIIYFDSLWVEHITKETKIFIGNKNVTANIYRIQAYSSTMSGYFCIGFVDFMLKIKVSLILRIYFLLMIIRRMIKSY